MGMTDSTNPVGYNEPETAAVAGEEMLVDVGGRRLYIRCMGEGSPTVILEHGLVNESEGWATVQRAGAQFTRVCAFDRAGRGKSDHAPTPRTSEDMVADLHALLENAHVHGPYILVGNGLGALNARVYTHIYPDDVVGVVLVDSMHPDQFDRFDENLPPETPHDPEVLRRFRQFFTQDYKDPAKNREGFDQLASHEQGRAVTSLGDLPMVVLAAEESLLRMPQTELGMHMSKVWHELQRDLSRLSSNSKFIVIEDSGHFIQIDKPQAVIDAIREVVEQVRSR